MKRWKCIKSKYEDEYTVGKIYETADNGYGLIDNNGHESVFRVDDFNQGYTVNFEEIKENDMFKVGDRVRVNDDYYVEELRGKIGVIRKYGNVAYDYDMVIEFKDISNISSMLLHDCHNVFSFRKGRWFKNSEVSLVSNPTREIHITTKDTTTYGVLKENGKVIKKSTSNITQR